MSSKRLRVRILQKNARGMHFKGDISGFDEMEQSIDDAVLGVLEEVGEEAISYARRSGTYQDRTRELRNGNGYCIVLGGNVVKMRVASDGGHPNAVTETENLMIYSEKKSDGLYLANGKHYASYVESKGYDVITGAKLFAQRRSNRKMKNKRRK